jgi:hypothetical protein
MGSFFIWPYLNPLTWLHSTDLESPWHNPNLKPLKLYLLLNHAQYYREFQVQSVTFFTRSILVSIPWYWAQATQCRLLPLPYSSPFGTLVSLCVNRNLTGSYCPQTLSLNYHLSPKCLTLKIRDQKIWTSKWNFWSLYSFPPINLFVSFTNPSLRE